MSQSKRKGTLVGLLGMSFCGIGSGTALGFSCRRWQKHGQDEQIQDRKYDTNATNPPIALQKPYAANKTR